MVGLLVNKSEIEQLKEIFKHFDTNQDGFIDKNEFRAAVSKYQ